MTQNRQMDFDESNPIIDYDLARQIKAEHEASRKVSPSEIQSHHERALVGLILLDPSALDRVEIELGGYQWINDTCRALFPVLVDMRRKGDPIADIRSVALVAKPFGVAAGELGRLVTNDAGMPGQDAYHLGFLTEATERSRLRRIASEIQRRVEDPTVSPDEIQDFVSKQLFATATKATQAKNAGSIMLEVVAQSREQKTTASVKTGIADLDACIGGMRAGQMIVLAARPSVGKSALCAQIAINSAKENNATLFVSLEMTSKETVARALAMETGLDMRTILDGHLTMDGINQAERVAKAYQSIPLLIEDRRGMNIDRLTTLIRSTAARRKLGLVVIDYIGLLPPPGHALKRWELMTEISNGLKTLAQTESIPILALCQLNRESEGEVPKLSHLRDSGSIEQDADIVLLLHREKRNAPETELFVAKNRNGPVGKIDLHFDATRFEFKTSFGGQPWQP